MHMSFHVLEWTNLRLEQPKSCEVYRVLRRLSSVVGALSVLIEINNGREFSEGFMPLKGRSQDQDEQGIPTRFEALFASHQRSVSATSRHRGATVKVAIEIEDQDKCQQSETLYGRVKKTR